jgi:hypothetical protein
MLQQWWWKRQQLGRRRHQRGRMIQEGRLQVEAVADDAPAAVAGLVAVEEVLQGWRRQHQLAGDAPAAVAKAATAEKRGWR